MSVSAVDSAPSGVQGLPLAAQNTSATSSPAGGSLDSMFMKLLITQLQNQDPLSPMDASSFVSQLVQVNSLDQVTQINQLLQNALGNH